MIKKSFPLRILGIDPGTATTDWAVITEKEGAVCPLGYGHLSTSKELTEEKRLEEIAADLEKLIEQYQPDEAAVEELFFFKNQKTVIQVAQARGVILLTLRKKNVKVTGYTPLQIKQALTGYGRAEKKQMQAMTKSLLGLQEIPRPDDTADAIAVALCHLHSRKMLGL